MHAIQVRNLHKSFGKTHVLRGIDFEIQPGEGVVLLGANGCGKSTLMRCLNGLETPDGGEIFVQDRAVSRVSRRNRQLRRSVGVVFQRFNLVANLSAFQNVLFGAVGRCRAGVVSTMAPFASAELRDEAMACLERVGLEDRAGFQADHLSGGQQQRVAIARMLIQRPEIVLADEPIASLDPSSGRRIMDLLWEIVDERRLTVLCTLHQLDVARRYASRIIGMKAGRVEIDAPAINVPDSAMEALYQGTPRVDQAKTPEPQPAAAAVA